MVAVLVQLLLEHFVDLVERAQEDLAKTKLSMDGDQNKQVSVSLSVHIIY